MLALAALLAALTLQEPPPEASTSTATAQATPAQGAETEEARARLGELRAHAEQAQAALDAGNLAEARSLVREALEVLDREPPIELDKASIEVVRGLGLVGWHAQAPELARTAWTRELEVRERTLPEDHPGLLTARNNLALTMKAMGDLAGARALQEAVLEADERTLPEDHPELLTARSNLAATMKAMGDLAGARALQEAVLEASERTLPEDHPDLLMTRGNLALTMKAMGDLAGARALQEAVLEASERTLPEGHPGLLTARGNLAVTFSQMDDLGGARALQEAVLEARERTLPEDHPDLLRARSNLAGTLAGLEARDELATQTAALADGVAERLATGLASSTRASGESARAEADRLSKLLFFTSSLDSPAPLVEGTFEALELARHVATAADVRPQEEAADRELEQLRWEASRLRSRLNDLFAAEGGHAGEADFASLVLERDRVERRLRERLFASGTFLERIDAGAVAAALPENAVAVGYRRYERYSLDPERGHKLSSVASLLAHVLGQDGTLQRVELGPIDELEALVEAWRATVGKPLARGMATDEPGDGAERAAARALSERVLGPVLAAAGPDVETLFVCLDDALHLVPLDALPMLGNANDEDALIGDALDLRFEVSFARLIQAGRSGDDPAPGPEDGALVALGGASFNAAPRAPDAEPDAEPAAEEPLAPVEASVDRAGPGGQLFGPLRQTQFEAENLGLLFEEIFESEPFVLMKKGASKDALERHAANARWLHVATHGYFAPESVRSQADPRAEGEDALWTRSTLEDRVTGLAPMALCGLALAGANRGRDSLGRVPGILTAEELAGWDLSACELAVLSACETNVGITRAGQGLQSLQAALHMAGARASITSLWKVDDELTRKLMEDFYTRLWVNEEPKAEALWNAKMALRKQGAATRDWAGWVLVGDPD